MFHQLNFVKVKIKCKKEGRAMFHQLRALPDCSARTGTYGNCCHPKSRRNAQCSGEGQMIERFVQTNKPRGILST
jgi:hypothetical protein